MNIGSSDWFLHAFKTIFLTLIVVGVPAIAYKMCDDSSDKRETSSRTETQQNGPTRLKHPIFDSKEYKENMEEIDRMLNNGYNSPTDSSGF